MAEPLEQDDEQEDWEELAGEVQTYLRGARAAHRREQQQSLLFYAYVVALFGAFYLAPYTAGLLRLAEHTGVVTPLADRLVPALPPAACGVVLLALTAAVTDGLWRGPVVLDPPGVGWLLPAPAAWAPLLRRRLLFSLGAYSSGGSILALALGFLVQLGARAGVSAMLVPVALSGLVLGVACVGLGSLVERHDAVVRAAPGRLAVVRGGVVAALALAGWVAWSPHSLPRVVSSVLLWSGPWGWAAQPLVASARADRAPLWPVGLLLAAGCAAVAWRRAWSQVAGISGSVLRARTRSSRGVFAALVAGDLRQATLSVRGATSTRAAAPRVRIPAPHRSWLIVPWRTVLGWVRAPRRPGWAVLAQASAYTVVALAARVSGWERAVTATLGVLLAYAAAGQLLEAARVEADDVRPSRALRYRFPALMLLHGAAPLLLLVGMGALATGLTLGSGGAGGAAGGLLLGAPALVAGGLAAACRGPLSTRVMAGNETALGNTAIVGIAVWYARAPLAILAAVLPGVLLGAARGLSAAVVQYTVVATALMVTWARHAARSHYAR